MRCSSFRWATPRKSSISPSPSRPASKSSTRLARTFMFRWGISGCMPAGCRYTPASTAIVRGLGDNDVRHRFTLAFLTESPKEWPIVVRDFKFSLLSSLQSARWFSINAGFDTNGDGFPFPDRVGTSARNSYKGDPFYNVDVRLQREIPFTERVKGEASVEVFNLLNRPNVLDVDHVYGLADFAGPVPKEFGDHISSPGNPTFGSPKFAAEARQLQLSFRITF